MRITLFGWLMCQLCGQHAVAHYLVVGKPSDAAGRCTYAICNRCYYNNK